MQIYLFLNLCKSRARACIWAGSWPAYYGPVLHTEGRVQSTKPASGNWVVAVSGDEIQNAKEDWQRWAGAVSGGALLETDTGNFFIQNSE